MCLSEDPINAVSTKYKVAAALPRSNANYDVLIQAIPVTYVLEVLKLTT